MIGHYHNFKEQKNTVINSHYNDEFNKNYNGLNQDTESRNLMQMRVKDLRSSHIKFG